MGSSIVTTWTSRLLLMWSIMPARVVVLPEPVGPVTSTRPRGLERQRREHGRQAEVLERDRPDRHPAEDQPGAAAGPEGVDAEPADTGEGVGEVGLVLAAELLDEVGPEHLGDHLLGVGGAQVAGLELAQAAVDAHARRGAHLAVQVGAPPHSTRARRNGSIVDALTRSVSA